MYHNEYMNVLYELKFPTRMSKRHHKVVFMRVVWVSFQHHVECRKIFW